MAPYRALDGLTKSKHGALFKGNNLQVTLIRLAPPTTDVQPSLQEKVLGMLRQAVAAALQEKEEELIEDEEEVPADTWEKEKLDAQAWLDSRWKERHFTTPGSVHAEAGLMALSRAKLLPGFLVCRFLLVA